MVGPATGEGPAADGRQFNGRCQQTIGPSRAKRTPDRVLSPARCYAIAVVAVVVCPSLRLSQASGGFRGGRAGSAPPLRATQRRIILTRSSHYAVICTFGHVS